MRGKEGGKKGHGRGIEGAKGVEESEGEGEGEGEGENVGCWARALSS